MNDERNPGMIEMAMLGIHLHDHGDGLEVTLETPKGALGFLLTVEDVAKIRRALQQYEQAQKPEQS